MDTRTSTWQYYDLRGLSKQLPRQRYQRPSVINEGGKWKVRYERDFLQPDGTIKRRRPKVTIGPSVGPGKLTETQAQKIADGRILKAVNQRDAKPTSLMTFEGYFRSGYQDQFEGTSGNNQSTVNSIMSKHVLPVIGTTALCDMTHKALQNLIQALRARGFSYSLLKAVRKSASAVFNHAIENGVVDPPNPFAKVELPKTMPRLKRGHHALLVTEPQEAPWSRQQITSEMQAAYVFRHLPEPYNILFLLSTTASPGPAELLGLRWDHLNLGETPRIMGPHRIPPHAYLIDANYAGKGLLADVKTAWRARVLPLPEIALPLLLRWRSGSRFTKPDDFVFAAQRSVNGWPVNPNNANKRQFKKLADAMDTRMTWYSFRHTFSTIHEEKFGRPAQKDALMGHAPDVPQGYTHPDFERVLRKVVNEIAVMITLGATSEELMPTQAKVVSIR